LPVCVPGITTAGASLTGRTVMATLVAWVFEPPNPVLPRSSALTASDSTPL
jgi:hypothetical protein